MSENLKHCIENQNVEENYEDIKIEDDLDIGPTVLQKSHIVNYINPALDKQTNPDDLDNVKIKEELLDKTGIYLKNEIRDALFPKNNENEFKTEINDEQIKHEVVGNTQYLCEICKSYLQCLSALKNHMQSHTFNYFNENKVKNENDNIELKDRENNTDNVSTNKKERYKEKTTEKHNFRKYSIENETDNVEVKEKNIENKGKTRKKYLKKNDVRLNFNKSNKDINEHNKNELVNLVTSDNVILQNNRQHANYNNLKTSENKNPTRNYKNDFVQITTSEENTRNDKSIIESKRDTDVNVVIADNKENYTKEFNVDNSLKDLPFSEKHYSEKGTNANRNYDKKFICEICFRSYKYKATLRIHVRNSHEGLRSYVNCDLCSKKYSRKDCLDNHVKRYHLRMKNQRCKCEYCGQSYFDKSALSRHKIHYCPKNQNRKKAPNYDFTCKLCKKKYVSSELFENHIADHPKYVCDYCDVTYHLKYYLAVHIQREHLKLRHRCKTCGNEYVTRYNLKKHLKNKCLNFE